MAKGRQPRGKARHKNAGMICAFDGCGRDSACGGLCSACYAYMRYWKDRAPGDIINRIQQIQLWERRLDSFGAKVTTIRKKRRKAA